MVRSRSLIFAALLTAFGSILLMTYLQNRGASDRAATASALAASAPVASSQPENRGSSDRAATASALAASAPVAPTSQPDAKAAAAPAAAASSTATAKESPAATGWMMTSQPVREVVLGSTASDSGFKLQVELTSLGAAVKTAKLTDYFTTVADKRRHNRDPETYDQAVRESDKLKGHYALLNPVGPAGDETYPLATRQITFLSQGRQVKLSLSGPRWSVGNVRTETAENGEILSQSVTFTCRIHRDNQPLLLLEKTYTLKKGSYSIIVDLKAVSLGKDRKIEFSLTQLSTTGLPREDVRTDSRMLASGQYEDGKVGVEKLTVKDASKMTPGLAGARRLGRSDAAKPVLWVGQTNKFFAALAYVVPKDPKSLAAPRAKASFFGAVVAEPDGSHALLGGITLGPYELAPGSTAANRIDLFCGPKLRSVFDDTPLYRTLGYKKTLSFGSCCTFAPLTLGMMWLLEFFSKVMFGNYGLAIILLVALVRLVLHPLTKKGQVSMSRMQKLQPEMAKIKEKYANDKARQNKEVMALYKTQGFSPMLGCLPMILQMPIWIALYTGLNATVELRHAAFLPVWITDLAAPDALLTWSDSLPLIGNTFNLLPILLAVAMFLQQKYSPQSAAPAATDQAQAQQKMMRYLLPGMMIAFFYKAPSGLTMYIMTSTFAGVVEQYVIRKHIREKAAAEAAAETKVAIPGKRFRGQKPKKPKGPRI